MNKVYGLRLQRLLLACAAFSLLLIPGMHVIAQDAAEHSMESMNHDDHQMTPEMFAVFRERVPALAESTDQQIELQMKMMDPGESRYISAASVHGEAGVLVLIHGFGPTGDRIMAETVKPLSGIFPSAMSSGMSMMSAAPIQESLDALEKAGVKKIVVVPMVSSKRNTLMYQWQYIFGEREHGGYYDVPQVTTDAEVIFTDPPAGHPLITQILLDHALEMSTDPANEVVFVIAHGPIHEEENQAQLVVMAGQAKRIQELGGFSRVEGVTLQDDATVAVRAANVVKLRQKLEAAIADDKRVLIVADLLAARSIQWKIEKDLAGLDYQFSVKGTTMHRNFKEWFQEAVSEALK